MFNLGGGGGVFLASPPLTFLLRAPEVGVGIKNEARLGRSCLAVRSSRTVHGNGAPDFTVGEVVVFKINFLPSPSSLVFLPHLATLDGPLNYFPLTPQPPPSGRGPALFMTPPRLQIHHQEGGKTLEKAERQHPSCLHRLLLLLFLLC